VKGNLIEKCLNPYKDSTPEELFRRVAGSKTTGIQWCTIAVQKKKRGYRRRKENRNSGCGPQKSSTALTVIWVAENYGGDLQKGKTPD